MHRFPLDSFLLSLAADGIRLTSRDYERVALVLQTGGPWTLARLRAALLALLAKNEDQHDIFAQRFDAFFTLPASAEDVYAEVDLERALADLRGLTQRPPPRHGLIPKSIPSFPRVFDRPARQPTRRQRPLFRWWRLASVALICGLIAALIMVYQLHAPAPLQICAAALEFGTVASDAQDTQSCTITNASNGPLTLDVVLDGAHATDFRLADTYTGHLLPAGEMFTVTVQFSPNPQSVSIRAAWLTIRVRDTDIVEAVALNGSLAPVRTVSSNQQRRYLDVPYVLDIQSIPVDRPDTWQRYAALAFALLCLALLYALWLWRAHKIPEDEPASFNPAGSRHFSPGAIGGTPGPWLADDLLDHLADSMGYFQSDERGRELDVRASIRATMQQGGTPALSFHKRKQIRALLILEDVLAEATAWNPLARELAAGIARRGVPVLYGQFQDAPDMFKTTDGIVHHLDDLADQRQAYLLLIFTDGKSLCQPEHMFTLEALARWPMLAWLDVREPRFWDASTVLPTRYGIPIYPATPAGLLLVARRFLTEQGQATDFTDVAHHLQELPDQASMCFDAYVEHLLGEALLWGQDCAMLQPVSPGLADALRQTFHPDLPAEQIERLYALPGTRSNVVGMRFSDEVLMVLRRGFLTRRTEHEQEEILRFILHTIDQARPDDPDGLAGLAWETVRERVRLELEPDQALERLAQMAQTPLGGALSSSLDNFGFPEQTEKIPLRLKPTSPAALQRLARIATDFPIHKLDAFPIAWGHRVALGVLTVLSIGLAGWSAWSAWNVPPPDQNWQVLGLDDTTMARLERQDGTDWTPLASGTIAALPGEHDLEHDQTYRLTLYGGGHHTAMEFPFGPGHRTMLQITAERQHAIRPCQEAYPDMGLTIERCPTLHPAIVEAVYFPSWRERWQQHTRGKPVPADRLSIGIELVGSQAAEQTHTGWHDLLWQTGSVDLIYTIQADQFDRAWPQIQADLGPRLQQSQVIWWTDNQNHATAKLAAELAVCDGVLFPGSDLSWLRKLFDSGDRPLIMQEEIMHAMPPGLAAIAGSVALFRPAEDTAALLVSTKGITATITLTGPDGTTLPPGKNGDWFAELPPGAWQVRAEAEGYAPAEQTIAVTDDTPQIAVIDLASVAHATATSTETPAEPPLPIPIPELVEIPAGPFLMGSSNADLLADNSEKPQHELTLETYWIGKTEVTNAQFRPFVEGDGYSNSEYWTKTGWQWREDEGITAPCAWDDPQWNSDTQPVVCISWFEAVAYTRWLSAQTGQEFRLPTEAEWEKAARGPDGLIWPWGNEWQDGRANIDEAGIGQTTPVGQFPDGASPYGVLDMAGNAWEWTATQWPKGYPYVVEDEWTDAYLEQAADFRVLRSGSYSFEKEYVRGANRYSTTSRATATATTVCGSPVIPARSTVGNNQLVL